MKYLIPLEVRSYLPVVKESNPALKTKEDMEILSPPGRIRRDKAIAGQLRQLRSREPSGSYKRNYINVDIEKKLFKQVTLLLYISYFLTHCKSTLATVQNI